MKKRVLLSLIFTSLAHGALVLGQDGAGPAPPQTVQAAAWTRYAYSGEAFSAELPWMPWVFQTVRPTSERSSDNEKVRVFGLYADEVVYMIVLFHNPHSSESDDKLAAYNWGRPQPKLKEEVKLGELKGREYDLGFNFKGAARLFRTKNRAYLVKAFSDVEGHEQAIERFLNSFSLDKQPQGQLITDNAPGVPPPTLTSGASGVAGESPYKSAELVRKALIVYKPEPGFTEEARTNNVVGVVRLRAILHASGAVRSISVVKGLPDGLTEKAVAAARHILFLPAFKDGRRVSQYVVLEYNFNIY